MYENTGIAVRKQSEWVYENLRNPQVGKSHWSDPVVLATLSASACCAAMFFSHEKRQGNQALVPPDVFRSRALTGANTIMLLVGIAVFAGWYILALFLEEGLGLHPLTVGLALLPLPLTVIAAAQLSARAMSSLGGRLSVLVAILPIAVGLAILGETRSRSLAVVLPSATLMALGAGASFSPLNWYATADVERTRAGLASGLINTTRQVGGSLGIALLATVAMINTPHSASGPFVAGDTAQGLMAGDAAAFRFAALVSCLAFLLCWVLPADRVRLPSNQTDPRVPLAE